jgi:hypothetical protein
MELDAEFAGRLEPAHFCQLGGVAAAKVARFALV